MADDIAYGCAKGNIRATEMNWIHLYMSIGMVHVRKQLYDKENIQACGRVCIFVSNGIMSQKIYCATLYAQ